MCTFFTDVFFSILALMLSSENFFRAKHQSYERLNFIERSSHPSVCINCRRTVTLTRGIDDFYLKRLVVLNKKSIVSNNSGQLAHVLQFKKGLNAIFVIFKMLLEPAQTD